MFKTIFRGFFPAKKPKIECFECGKTDCEYFEEIDEEYDPEEGLPCCRHCDSIPPKDYCGSCFQDWFDHQI